MVEVFSIQMHTSMTQQKCIPCNHCSKEYTPFLTFSIQFPFVFDMFCLQLALFPNKHG